MAATLMAQINGNSYDVERINFGDSTDIKTFEFPISEMTVTLKTSATISKNQWIRIIYRQATIAKYWITSVNADGRGLVDIIAKSGLYFLDLTEMSAFFPVAHAADDLLERVFTEANVDLSEVIIDSDVVYIGGSTDIEITGLLPKHSARERLQHLCWRLGAYPVTVGIGDKAIRIKRLPGLLDTIVFDKTKTFWKPEVRDADFVSTIELVYYRYQQYQTPPPGVEVYQGEDGNYYKITDVTEYATNPDDTPETPYNSVNVSDIYIITAAEKDDVMNWLRQMLFAEKTVRCSILFTGALNVVIGDRIKIPFFGGDYFGYLKEMSFTFGVNKVKAYCELIGTTFVPEV